MHACCCCGVVGVVVALLALWRCCGVVGVVALWRCCGVVGVVALLWRCCGVVGVVALLWRCCGVVGVVAQHVVFYMQIIPVKSDVVFCVQMREWCKLQYSGACDGTLWCHRFYSYE